jgi:phenylalanyl-tRNA synthetase beta chain
LFLAGDKQAESWQQKSRSVDFHDLSSAVQKVLQRLHIKNTETKEAELAIFSYGLCYKVNNREVVNLGMLQPSICKFLDIKGQVFYADIDWDYLIKQYSAGLVVAEVPKFPEVRRDLSLVIDKSVSFKNIKQLATSNERRLLKAVNIFDVYEGENIGPGKKSYSVSFVLQDENATLTDAVIDKTMQRLMQVFEKELNAIIRK